MLHKLKLLYDLPPRATVRLLRNKLSGGGGMTVDDLLHSDKNMRTQRVYDFLSRYEAVLGRKIGWPGFDFQGARVLELGPGPVLGFAPLAVFNGAESCLCIEPEAVPGVLDDERLREMYFFNLHNDLTNVYGPKMDFEEFMEALARRVRVERATVLDARLEGPIDVILSNSCLEHVFPLEESLRGIGKESSEGCRFVHLVDFGNHRSKANPFSGIYDRTPEEYFRTFGRGVNLKRPPDVLRALQDAGFNAVLTPTSVRTDLLPENIHQYWIERYSREDLAIRVALFSDPGS